jgi:CO dehydrogenase nickel-insertion accessory protein CooC1
LRHINQQAGWVNYMSGRKEGNSRICSVSGWHGISWIACDSIQYSIHVCCWIVITLLVMTTSSSVEINSVCACYLNNLARRIIKL